MKVVIAKFISAFVFKRGVLFQKYFYVFNKMAKCSIDIVVQTWSHSIAYAWSSKVLPQPIVWNRFVKLMITTWYSVLQETSLHSWVRIFHLSRPQMFSCRNFRWWICNTANGRWVLAASSYGALVPSTGLNRLPKTSEPGLFCA